jgi:elongation factor G
MGLTSENIRNIAVSGHVGTGKTSLVEHMLFAGDAIPKAELVGSGKTVSDCTPEEIEKGISVHTTLSHYTWKDVKINLLDTPGSSDFVGEVVAGFRSAESSLLLVDATSGVQIETIKLWRRLDNRNMPRFVFISKMDKERADFSGALKDLEEKFSARFVPVCIPMGSADSYSGLINLIENKAYANPEAGKKEKGEDIPADMNDTVEEYRMALIEAAAEGDDALMEKYFEEETLTADEIRHGLTEGLKNNKFVPVLCGAAELGSGIASLSNFIVTAAPSPAGAVETALNGGEESKEVPITQDGTFSGYVFKTSIDQFSGKLSYMKTVTGTLTSETDLFCARTQKKEKVSKLYTTVGKKLIETSEITAGDLGVLAKAGEIITNDTLCTPDNVVEYEHLKHPHPVHSVAVSAVSKKDEDKMNEFLQRAAEEDPTFIITHNQETKETVISGMGELQINMILDKIKANQKIEIETKVPKVAYRETITKSSDAEYTHKKQTGGHGQFGRVMIKIRPLERGKQYEFENIIKGGSVSKGYIPGIEKGLHEAMETGVLAKYPVVDVGVTLYDGKEHPVDSSEMAFKMAARGALYASMEKAGPVLLEPIMNLRVFVDEEYLGDVLSDLSSRRGRVSGQEQLGGGIVEVDAQVPQAEMLRYSIDLRSITSGTASFEMEFDHYEPISGKIADAVIADAKSGDDSE